MTTSSEPVTRFDHITIAAPSLDRAIADYTTLLGHAPTWRGVHPELGTESALFGLDNALIEITAPLPGNAASDGLRSWLDTTGGGLQAIAFGTEDAANASGTLRQRGMRATPPQPGEARDLAGNVRHYSTIDLSPRATRGVPVLLVERPDFTRLIDHGPTQTAALHALDHVALRTASIDNAKQVYGVGLGIRLALERDLNGVRMLFFRVGGVTLEVIEDSSVGDQDVFYGAAYRTHDIRAAHDHHRRAGCEVSELRSGHKPATTVYTVRNQTQGVATLVIHDPSRDKR